MPEHFLPRGVDLIDGIARLGAALGYVAERERPVEKGRASPPAVDVAWLGETGQEYPLMIFEIESSATNAAANNPVKVFGQTVDRFEKPLFFFHVFVTGGAGTSRLKVLERLFGSHNYRTYNLAQGDIGKLLKDILSQHRRLHRQLNLAPLLDELARDSWQAAPLADILQHAERLGYAADFIAEYAVRAPSQPIYRHRFLTLLANAATTPWSKRPREGYNTFIGAQWADPVHFGLLALDSLGEGGWLERLKVWQERSTYISQIGPHLGQSRDYDDFVLGIAPVLWALTAALMYRVQGAARYILDQIFAVLQRVEGASPAVSFFNAVWAIHIAVAAGERASFERARAFINDRGGIAPDVMYEPPSIVSVTQADPSWTTAIEAEREGVPPLEEWSRELARRYSRVAGHEELLFKLGIEVLTQPNAIYEWSPRTVLLLHAPSGLTSEHAA